MIKENNRKGINKSEDRGIRVPTLSNSLKGAISMCIYCGTNKYRKIYENHYGPIPKEDGISYEIHHIDGNHSNNDPINLKCVTIQEHYDIHYAQGDWAVCILIAQQRLSVPSSVLKELRSANGKKVAKMMLKKGIHPFQRRPDGTSIQTDKVNAGTHILLSGDIQRKSNADRISAGTHHFLKKNDNSSLGNTVCQRMMENGTHPFLNHEWQMQKSKKAVLVGTHNFIGAETQLKRIANGTHPSQVTWKCDICGKEGKGKGNYSRAHGINCKS
jgi:hypothetical protein